MASRSMDRQKLAVDAELKQARKTEEALVAVAVRRRVPQRLTGIADAAKIDHRFLHGDFDALSVWLGQERVTPAMLQRGEYGARVGVPRLLDRLDALGLPATFFIPGHTIESFPAECEAVLGAVRQPLTSDLAPPELIGRYFGLMTMVFQGCGNISSGNMWPLAMYSKA